MASDRKGRSRLRLVNLDAVGGESGTVVDGPQQEVVALSLSYRVLISEQAEVWTLSGLLADGDVTKEDIGEISLVLIPGDEQPATSVTGFIAPRPPYILGLSEAKLREELRSLLMQLGYDRDGYYLSVAFGGKHLYDEAFDRT